MKYTTAIGEAGQAYIDRFREHAHPLPAQFRWEELWNAMVAATPTVGRIVRTKNSMFGEPGTAVDMQVESWGVLPIQPRRARKVGGSYQATGTVVSEFKTKAGATRYVFEFDEPDGVLHIFGPAQLEFGDWPSPGDTWRALCEFLLTADEPIAFLRLWNEGSFEVCRREWPEAPEAVYPTGA